jgi:uncharacterized protein YcnI
MRNKTIIGTAAAVGAGFLLAFTSPLAANAHVSVDPSVTSAGGYSVLTFGINHGCEGSPTNIVTIEIPESVLTVTPTVNANWTVEKVMSPISPAVTDAHGNELTERVTSIVYTALTPLAADLRDQLSLQVALPNGDAGDVLEFVTTQDCAVGQMVWEGEDVPNIVLTAAEEGSAHDHAAATTEDAAAHDSAAAETAATSDTLARILGLGGLALGAAGLTLAIVNRRNKKA